MPGTEDSDLAMLSSFIHRLQWRLRVNRKTRWGTERGMSTNARRTREPIKRVVHAFLSLTLLAVFGDLPVAVATVLSLNMAVVKVTSMRRGKRALKFYDSTVGA